VLVGLLVVPAVLGLTGLVALGPARSHPPEPSSAVLALPLPEAAPGPVHRVVALGDSVATGTACGCDDYVALLARTLDRRQDASVTSTNLAVGGATSADVLTQLSGEQTRSALSRADLVVVTIGANDVESVSDPTSCPAPSAGSRQGDDVVEACYRRQLSALEANLDRTLGEVASMMTAPGARVLVTGYWNVFLDGAIARAKGPAYVALADAATRAVNRRIEAAASAHGATYVDLFTAFRGSDGSEDCTPLLAPDGDHPSAQGHALIARTLAAALA
jgi:lysophospholipase L1-like esterase